VIAALVLCVLASAAADKPMGFDEGIWFHVSRAWVDDGVPPYQGPIENKPPGIFYLFALSYLAAGADQTLPRIAGIAALLGVCLACYTLARRLAGRDAGLAAALVAGLMMASSRGADGADTSATESFMVLGTTAALARVASASADGGRRRWAMLQAGALFGAALAFKQTAVVTAPALVAFAWSLTPRSRRTLGRAAADLGWMALGTILVTAASLAPLFAAGVSLREYVQGAWLILLDPGSGNPFPDSPIVRLVTHYVWRRSPLLLLVLGAALFLGLRHRLTRRGVPWGAVAVWLVLDAGGALAAGNFFPHHFKQLVPSAAVASAIVLAELLDAVERRGLAGRRPALARAPALVLVGLLFLPYATLVNRIVGPPRDRTRADQLEVASWIREHTGPRDEVFTFVGGGLVQTASGRPSPSRYFNRNFIKSEASIRAVLRDLDARPPRLVVTEERFPGWLRDYLEGCCVLAHTVASYYQIFERRRPARP
jgi:4-amino-4-deoxy-L-arabinose transferase-like glycosyltransferase